MFYYLNKIYKKTMDSIFNSKITWKIKESIDNVVFTIYTNKNEVDNIMNILIENKVIFIFNNSRILNPDMTEEIELYKRTIKRINKLIDELEPLLESISCGFDLNVLFDEQCNFPSKFYIDNCNIEINSKKGDFFYEYYMNKINI